MYMKKYPCVYMRGGTSKAVFFHEKDLPEDKSLWDDIFLKVMGTPDVKQIDGREERFPRPARSRSLHRPTSRAWMWNTHSVRWIS